MPGKSPQSECRPVDDVQGAALLHSKREAIWLLGSLAVFAASMTVFEAVGIFAPRIGSAPVFLIVLPGMLSILALNVLLLRVKKRFRPEGGRAREPIAWRRWFGSWRVQHALLGGPGVRDAARWLGWSRVTLRFFIACLVGIPVTLWIVFAVVTTVRGG